MLEALAFYFFSAILAWQLGALRAPAPPAMRVIGWVMTICFAAIAFVSWQYLFILPLIFSIVITVLLAAAALLSSKPA